MERQLIERVAFFGLIIALLTSQAGQADEVRFADLFENVSDGGILVEAVPGDVLVFDGGVFETAGRPLVIIAEAIRIDAPTLVLSHALDATPAPMSGQADSGRTGLNGGAWGCGMKVFPFVGQLRVCKNEGQQGGTGQTGAAGRAGAPGAPIEIVVMQVDGDSLLFVVGNGQKGGRGQQGGPGGKGGLGLNGQNRAGDVFCNNQNRRLDGSMGGAGGRGGTGGSGGPGGAGSEITVTAPGVAPVSVMESSEPEATYEWVQLFIDESFTLEDPPKLVAVSVGGQRGDGGPGGPRGPGGGGGSAGRESHCGGGGQPGAPGARGNIGRQGDDGLFGSTGEITQVNP